MIDERDSQRTKRGTETRHERTGPVSRRSYLKLAGSTAAFAAAGATPVAGESYTTITVPENSKENIYVYDGETYENVLIDMTASGASAQIITRGSNWTIRDVGFKGIHPGGHYLITPGVESSSGTGLIENVYLGDGQVEGTGSGGIWINANLPHRGTITFRNVHVAGMVDNGLYGSGVGAQGYCGNHHVESSYFYNNTISNNRTNARCRRCDVYDSVVHVDGNNPDCGTGCSNPGSNHTRGFWSWYGETYLENVDVKVVDGTTFATAEGGYFTKNNVRSGSDADTTPPDCVPMSAVEAADGTDCETSGGGGDDGDGTGDTSSGDEHLEIVSVDGGPLFAYEFTVKGSVSMDTDNGDNSAESSNDSITDNGDGTYTVTGEVGNGYGDSYYYDGNILDWTADTDASNYDLYNDDTLVSTSELVADLFEIVSVDGGPLFSYSFDASDNVSLNTSNGDNSAETSNDSITDNGDGTFTVTGEVGNGYGDSYYFDGDLSNWTADTDDSNYDLYVNGSEIQPSDIGGDDGGSSGTVVDDFEDGDIAEYSFDRGASGASVVSSPTHSGSYALEYTGTYTEAISTSGLNAYPSAGDTFSCWVRASGGGNNLNFTWGVQDHDNRYYVKLYVEDGKMYVFTYENGSGTSHDGDSGLSLSQDAWYRLEVNWATDGTQTVTLYDSGGTQLSQISMVDSTWTSGGVGYDAYLSSGQSVYFDDVTIE